MVAGGRGALVTLLAFATAMTKTGRWFITEYRLPRLTARQWMIVVAVLGTETGLVEVRMRASANDPMFFWWTPILVQLAILHVLAFAPAGLVLLNRHVRRDRPATLDTRIPCVSS